MMYLRPAQIQQELSGIQCASTGISDDASLIKDVPVPSMSPREPSSSLPLLACIYSQMASNLRHRARMAGWQDGWLPISIQCRNSVQFSGQGTGRVRPLLDMIGFCISMHANLISGVRGPLASKVRMSLSRYQPGAVSRLLKVKFEPRSLNPQLSSLCCFG